MTRFCQDLKQVQVMRGSGKFVVHVLSGAPQLWEIYFYMGRIVWATGQKHRARRWLRVLRQHCPTLLAEAWARQIADWSDKARAEDSGDYWEAEILTQAMQAGVMDLSQAKAIVNTYVQEAAFHAIDHDQLKCEWQVQKNLPQQFLWLDVDQVLMQASLFCNQWRSVWSIQADRDNLKLSPNQAPVIQNADSLQQRVSPATYQALTQLLNAQNTFWDLALVMKKPMERVVASLLPFINEATIALQEVPDLPLPYARSPHEHSIIAKAEHREGVICPGSKGLIACIDDSPVIGKALEHILAPLGYEVLSILDPLQSISILIQQKPRLIFLDLIMPNTNGYELCSFFRKSAAFRDTPIVMLTGHDGVIDRIRSKVSGSTDFLGKPPESEKVRQVVYRLLEQEIMAESSA
jgi:two-component system, chemotaxis family, response regulator PixG